MLNMKFQLLIKTKIPTNEEVALSLSDVVLIKLINVKMPTSTGSTPGRYEKLMT